MKKLQNGRSMIEMLGVLAIIGVLSIGGLAGYTMAMNRHRANQVIDYATKCAVIAQTQGTGAEIASTSCAGAQYMGAQVGVTGIADDAITVAREDQGNTAVTVIFTAANGASQAMASRLGIGGDATTTFYFSPETVANGGWSLANPLN